MNVILFAQHNLIWGKGLISYFFKAEMNLQMLHLISLSFM